MTPSQTIAEMKRFELVRDRIWPFLRIFLKRFLTPRCKRCILTKHSADLYDGICEICLSPRVQKQPLVQKRLLLYTMNCMILDAMRLKRLNRNYDAVVLFSGGKDSAYMIHRLRKDFPTLRILALTIDNTFMSEVALHNAKRIIEKLGIEHVMIRPPAKLMEKMFSYAFTHLNARGCSGTVDQFDGDFFCDVARNFCATNKIPLMFVGLSKTQVERIMGIENFLSPDEQETLNRESVAEIPLKDIFTPSEIKKYFWQGEDKKPFERPKVIYPFYAWGLGEDEIKAYALNHDLIEPGYDSPLVTNSKLIPLMCLVDMAKLGYSSFEPEFAEMIREGKAERKSWLYTFEMMEYSAKTGRFISKGIDEAISRLGLSREELGIGIQKKSVHYRSHWLRWSKPC